MNRNDVVGYWALAACLFQVFQVTQAWASLVVEPIYPGQSVLNESQSQQTFASLSVLRQPMAPPPPSASELGNRLAGAPSKSLLLLLPTLNDQGARSVAAPLPGYAAEGWSGDSNEPVAGVYTPSHRLSDWQELARANQGLTGGVFKEIVGSSDVKTTLLDLRVELRKFVGGTVFDAESRQVLDPSRTERAEIKSLEGDSTRTSGPPRSAAEQEMDSVRASVMFWQLIDQVKPWALFALVMYWAFLAIRGYLRLQTRRRISFLQSRSHAHSRSRRDRLTSRTSSRASTTSGSRPDS
ncbi:hypothetical protein ACVBEH_02525 [Roseateles sp. GG27B]